MRSKLRSAIPFLALGLALVGSLRCAGRATESFFDDTSAGVDAGRRDGGGRHWDGGGRPDAGRDGGTDAGSDGGSDGGTSQRGRIRFCNLFSASTATPLVPFAPYAFDVYLEGQGTPLVAGLGYGGPASISPDQEIPAQQTVFEVRRAGDSPAASPLFRSAPVDIAAGARLTAFLVAGTGTPQPILELKVLEDRFATPAAGAVRIRFFNYALLPSPLRIYGSDPANPIATVPFKDSSLPEGIELPASAAISLTLRGSSLSFPGGQTSFTLPADLAENQVLVVVEGNPNGTVPSDPQALKLLFWPANGPARTSEQDPVLYFVNATPGSPPLNLSLQGRSLLGTSSLTFPSALGFAMKPVQLPPSATGYSLDVFDASPPDPTLIAQVATGPLASGQRYLGVLSEVTPTTAQLTVYRSAFPSRSVAGRIDGRVRVLDVVTSPGPLDLGTIDASSSFKPLLTNLDAGFASPEAGEPIAPDRWVDATSYRVRYAYRSAGAVTTNEATGLPLTAPPNSARFFLLAGNEDSIDPVDLFRFIIISTDSATWGGQMASSFVRK